VSIGVGVIGTGFMGRTWTEVAANHVDETHVVAVAGGKRAPALASDYGADLAASPAELLKRADVDLVVVATQPDSHRDYVVQAANAGKHALVEKPMSLDSREAAEMAEAHDRSGTRLAVCSQHRFRASPVAALKLIRDGAIGTVRMVRAQGVITQDEEAEPHNEPYADMGFHILDVLRALVDSPATRAFAQQASYKGTPPLRGSTMAVYRFKNDVMASIWISYELPKPGLGSMVQYLITGSKGMIQLDSYGQVELGNADGWKVAFEQPPFDPNNPNDPIRLQAYADELRDVVGAIRERREPLVSGHWGRDTMELIDAARIAGETGHAVPLPLSANR
jgi:predicted dehydrogenase